MGCSCGLGGGGRGVGNGCVTPPPTHVPTNGAIIYKVDCALGGEADGGGAPRPPTPRKPLPLVKRRQEAVLLCNKSLVSRLLAPFGSIVHVAALASPWACQALSARIAATAQVTPPQTTVGPEKEVRS